MNEFRKTASWKLHYRFYSTCEIKTSLLTDRFLIKWYLDLKTGKYSTSCTLKFASLPDVNKESENHANIFIFGIKHRPNLLMTPSNLSLSINMIIDLLWNLFKPLKSYKLVVENVNLVSRKKWAKHYCAGSKDIN